VGEAGSITVVVEGLEMMTSIFRIFKRLSLALSFNFDVKCCNGKWAQLDELMLATCFPFLSPAPSTNPYHLLCSRFLNQGSTRSSSSMDMNSIFHDLVT